MNLREQLKREEGVRPSAYADHLGFLTIGVGRLIDARKGAGLSADEIDYLLDNDIREKTAEVFAALPWVEQMTEPRQAVVIGMAFQMGTKGLLAFKNTLSAMQAGRYAEAARGMLGSLWAKQTPQRAGRMAKQMETGAWQ
jgi:lysozyme